MVDRHRAYRRWRLRRLGLLVPVLAGALATQFWLAAGSASPPWLRLISLGSCGLVLTLVGYVLAQTLICARLHARGDRVGARLLREELAPTRRAALAAAVLLAIVNVVPYVMPATPGTPAVAPSRRRCQFAPVPAPAAVDVSDEPPAVAALPAASAPATPPPEPSMPDLRPIKEELPLQLALLGIEAAPAPTAGFPLLGGATHEPEVTAADEGEKGIPRFRPDDEKGFQLIGEGSLVLALERLGLPREGNFGEWLPPEMRLDVSFLQGDGRGTEVTVLVDVPIGPNESILTTIALGRLAEPGGEFLEDSASTSWQRVILAYERRLAGYTRHAPFDLAFSIGVSVDRFRASGDADPLDSSTRLSPYVAVDAAVWQAGTTGLLMHAGYSVPLNVTGASSGVLDLSATVQIDLTENISVHAGYRYLVLRLRAYESPSIAASSQAERSEEFSGPLAGIDVRF